MAGTRNVIIAGAGIGGLTAALTLTRAGLRTTVLEQAPQLEEAGAGIQLTPNATRILFQLGLADELARTAVEPEAIRVLSGPSAHEVIRIPLGRYASKRYVTTYGVIHRGHLQVDWPFGPDQPRVLDCRRLASPCGRICRTPLSDWPCQAGRSYP